MFSGYPFHAPHQSCGPTNKHYYSKVKHLRCEVVCDHSYCDYPRCCCSNQGDNLKILPVLPFENQKQNIAVHYSHREFQSRIKKETKTTEIKSVLTDNQVDMISIFIIIFFLQASERAGILSPKI